MARDCGRDLRRSACDRHRRADPPAARDRGGDRPRHARRADRAPVVPSGPVGKHIRERRRAQSRAHRRGRGAARPHPRRQGTRSGEEPDRSRGRDGARRLAEVVEDGAGLEEAPRVAARHDREADQPTPCRSAHVAVQAVDHRRGRFAERDLHHPRAAGGFPRRSDAHVARAHVPVRDAGGAAPRLRRRDERERVEDAEGIPARRLDRPDRARKDVRAVPPGHARLAEARGRCLGARARNAGRQPAEARRRRQAVTRPRRAEGRRDGEQGHRE